MISSEWEKFKSSVIPPGASDIQLKEMKKAYYGGFVSAILAYQRLSSASWDAYAVEAKAEFETYLNSLFTEYN